MGALDEFLTPKPREDDPPVPPVGQIEVVPTGVALVGQADGHDNGRAKYVDVAAVLAGDLRAPKPTICSRSDGKSLLYRSAVNGFFGPPESGKTLASNCVAADVLFSGDSVLLVDVDHNGAPAILARMRDFGVSAEVLCDRARFRIATPEDSDEMLAIVSDAATWLPTLVVIDSVGEILPMFGASSNDSDDYSRVHRAVFSAFAKLGSAVIVIDHEAKGVESRAYGSTGTVAKKRAIDGSLLRFAVVDQFVPGSGGKSAMTIVKDRHGGVRATSPIGDKEPLAAVFALTASNGATNWEFRAPSNVRRPLPPTDLELVQAMSPAPTRYRDIKERQRWGDQRARNVWSEYLALGTDGSAPLHLS